MPPLWHVAEDLGLDPEATEPLARFEHMRATEAMDEFESGILGPEEQWPGAGKSDLHPGAEREIRSDAIDYACDHGFRALGLLAVFDQDSARLLAQRLMTVLRSEKNHLWPLTHATAPILDDDVLARDLADEPPSVVRDLCWCLLPDSLPTFPEPAPTRPAVVGTALAPYGIDIELLRLVVVGRSAGAYPAIVSDISTPAVLSTLFASIERALREARVDSFHWAMGLSTVQPTDPEVLTAVRACLRSPQAAYAVDDARGDFPMVSALVELGRELGP